MINTPRGADAYRRMNVETRSPLELVVMLYDGALRYLGEARSAIERRDVNARAEAVSRTLAILTAQDYARMGTQFGVLRLANDADAESVPLAGVHVVELDFPKFADGRAYSQAIALRRRGFAGEIRAVGAVLIDQLVQMQRTGFTSAVLRADQDPAHAQRQFDRFAAFYQGDVQQPAPQFRRAA